MTFFDSKVLPLRLQMYTPLETGLPKKSPFHVSEGSEDNQIVSPHLL
jgi:hypothetical protein